MSLNILSKKLAFPAEGPSRTPEEDVEHEAETGRANDGEHPRKRRLRPSVLRDQEHNRGQHVDRERNRKDADHVAHGMCGFAVGGG